MKNYLHNAVGRQTVQTELDGMVKNHGGGFSYEITPDVLLDRFLVMGTATSQYVGPDRLSVEALGRLLPMIQKRPLHCANVAVKAVVENRVLSKVPALFVYAAAHCHAMPNDRRKISLMLPDVVKTLSDMQTLFSFIKGTFGRTFSTSFTKAIRRWFANTPDSKLINQALKYRTRNGWAVRDILKMTHPVPTGEVQDALFGYLCESEKGRARALGLIGMVQAFEAARSVEDEHLLAKLITDQGLTWEHVPNEWLNSKVVWQALLPNLPMTALIRNLPKLTAVGAIDTQTRVQFVIDKLSADNLKKAKVHPFRLFLAWYGYKSCANRNLTWVAIPRIVAALESGIYSSMANVEMKGNVLVGCDVSGSMFWPDSRINGTGPEAGVAAGMIAACMKACNPSTEVKYFDNTLADSKFDALSLDSVLADMRNRRFGSTNPGLLLEYAIREKKRFDAFVVLTDNDVNGGYHMHGLLETYRRTVNPKAKMIVVGMTANNFSISKPDDILSMDVSGMDAGILNAIEKFVDM